MQKIYESPISYDMEITGNVQVFQTHVKGYMFQINRNNGKGFHKEHMPKMSLTVKKNHGQRSKSRLHLPLQRILPSTKPLPMAHVCILNRRSMFYTPVSSFCFMIFFFWLSKIYIIIIY